MPVAQMQPAPSPFEDHDALVRAVRQLPNDVMVEAMTSLADAAHSNDLVRIKEVAYSILLTARLLQNDDYRRGVKQLERMDEDGPPVAVDRDEYFARLRAV